MTGVFSVIVPEATVNWVLNPSAEADGNYSAHAGTTIIRASGAARFGAFAYVVTAVEDGGINLTLAALANAAHLVSFYLLGPYIGPIQVSLNGGTNWHPIVWIRGIVASNHWSRWGALIAAGQANGSTSLLIRDTTAEYMFIDGVQVEAKSYETTYIDGDQPGGSWSGLYHGSVSSRDTNYRLAGREVFLDEEGITIDAGLSGIGVPPIVNNVSEYALLPGAQYQSTQIKSRTIDLIAIAAGTSLIDLLQKRQQLIAWFGPVRGGQPARLGYWGADADRALYCDVRYVQGLQFSNVEGYIEKPAIRLLAVDPYWYADEQLSNEIDLQDSVTSVDYGSARIAGAWQALGSGFDQYVAAVAIDEARGRVYMAGAFTTANDVTVNGVCYWNGTTFVALGAGLGGGNAYALAIAPNGDLWVGGTFTSAGGVATDGLARWNIADGTWTAFDLGAGAGFYALAFDSAGNLYAGGDFTNWDGTANSDMLAKYDGSAWSAVGTGLNDAVKGLALDGRGNVYAAGEFATAGGLACQGIAKWDGAAWVNIGNLSGGTADGDALLRLRNGDILLAGTFSSVGGVSANNIARWNGTAWNALGSGLNSTGLCLAEGADNMLLVGGAFTAAGGITLSDRLALWNGYTWLHLDIDLPGSSAVTAVAIKADGALFVGYQTTGTAAAGAKTTVTPDGTADMYPVITLIGPSSGTLTLAWIENQSTRQRMYFDLTVNAGEMMTIDLRTGRKTITSSWRGLVQDQPLRGSDFATWRLQPGANTIAAFATGTLTGAMLVMNWTPAFMSVDGAA